MVIFLLLRSEMQQLFDSKVSMLFRPPFSL